MIFFSVVIPVFNRKELLDRALFNLTKQTFNNFEVIVNDDGSTEDIFSIVHKYKHQLDIKYFKNINFGGPALPRNNGIKIAKGKYIAFLDSDDWWAFNKLEYVFNYIQNTNHILFYHKLKYYPSRYLKKYLYSTNIKNNLISHIFIYGNPIATSSVVVRKDIIENIGLFSEKKKDISIEDVIAWIDIYNFNSNFLFINKSLGFYNNDSKSLSHSSKTNQIEREKYLFYKYYVNLNSKEKKMALISFYFKKARLYHQINSFDKAFIFYKKSFFNYYFLNQKFKTIILITLVKLKISL